MSSPSASFPTWARIHVGRSSSPEKDSNKLIKELESNGVRVLPVACDFVDKLSITHDRTQDTDLVKVAVRDLGFSKKARFGEICERARKLGLELVSQDAAFYAALQAGDQIAHCELVIFAMTAVTDPNDNPYVFRLIRNPDGVLGLGAGPGPGFPGDDLLLPENQLIFSRT